MVTLNNNRLPIFQWQLSSFLFLYFFSFSCDRKAQTPYYKLAIPLACVVGTFVLSVEYVVPWKTELGRPNAEGSYFLTMYGWPPLMAGMRQISSWGGGKIHKMHHHNICII